MLPFTNANTFHAFMFIMQSFLLCDTGTFRIFSPGRVMSAIMEHSLRHGRIPTTGWEPLWSCNFCDKIYTHLPTHPFSLSFFPDFKEMGESLPKRENLYELATKQIVTRDLIKHSKLKHTFSLPFFPDFAAIMCWLIALIMF